MVVEGRENARNVLEFYWLMKELFLRLLTYLSDLYVFF